MQNNSLLHQCLLLVLHLQLHQLHLLRLPLPQLLVTEVTVAQLQLTMSRHRPCQRV